MDRNAFYYIDEHREYWAKVLAEHDGFAEKFAGCFFEWIWTKRPNSPHVRRAAAALKACGLWEKYPVEKFLERLREYDPEIAEQVRTAVQ